MIKRLQPIFNMLPGRVRKALFVCYALTRRAMTLGVRGIVLDADGRVLLVRHTYVSGWHLPGGGVERGETFQQAMIKELEEEVEVYAKRAPKLIHVYQNTLASKYDHVALFLIEDWSGPANKTPDWEIAETGFFALDALPDGTTEPTRARLNEALAGQVARDIW